MNELRISISKSDKKEKIDEESQNNINKYNETNSNLEQTGINKENEYFKNIILDLEKEIEKEKNISKDKSEENRNIIYELKKKILNYEKEIIYYSNKNEKQRETLQLFSNEISNKINRINIDNLSKKLKKEKNKENALIKEKIDQQKSEIKNILSITKSNSIENESLKNKLSKFKNDGYSLDLLKNQENKILDLKKEIKFKKVQIEVHSKCNQIKSNLIKKLEELKKEINFYQEIYENSENELNNLKNKKKPKIILNNNTLIPQKNQVINIKLLNTSNNNINKMNKRIYEIKKNKYFSRKKIDLKKDEEEIIDIPYQISENFSEKELKAIFIGLDKNNSKFKNLLKEFTIQKKTVSILETKHKLDIKEKLNKINDIDEQVEYLNMKKRENDVDIELYQNLINKFNEKKKLYSYQIDELNHQIKEKMKINERKEKEINSLGEQLIKLKQIIKSGDYKSMKDLPEIEIQYIKDNLE